MKARFENITSAFYFPSKKKLDEIIMNGNYYHATFEDK